MDRAPLNLAHFHERRADKLIKQHRYEEALKAIETSLLYVEDAYKNVKIPQGLDVLRTQKWDYERKLGQVQMRKLQYDKMKCKEIVPSSQTETASNYIKKDVSNAQSIARSIDKTIKEFNDKYGSALLENIQEMEMQSKNDQNFNKQKGEKVNNSSKQMPVEHVDINRRLSVMNDNLPNTDDDLPSLAPLELPSFDYNVFGV